MPTVYQGSISLAKVKDGESGGPGAHGINTAIIYLYRRSADVPTAMPIGNLTYNFVTGEIKAIEPGSSLNGWTQNIDELDENDSSSSVIIDENSYLASSGAWVEDGTLVIEDSHILSGPDPLYFIAAIASSTENTDLIASTEWQGPTLMSQDGADGKSGIDGFNQATISLYQRASNIPSVPSGELTYIFDSGELNGNLGNWSRTISDNTSGYPCYVTTAAAISRESQDTIVSEDWSEPVIMVEDGKEGASGAHGVNTATVYLYRKSVDVPSVMPIGNLTYTFVTGVISATEPGSSLNGWVQNISSLSGTDPLYFIAAVASATTDTDLIASSEWQGPTLMAQDGEDGQDGKDGKDGQDGQPGVNGFNQATISLYQRVNSTPSVPSGNLTYTFSNGELSGNLGNWSRGVPANTNGYPCYVTSAAAINREAQDIIASSDWSSPVIMAEDGKEGPPGASGAHGVNTATVYLYRRSADAPTAMPIGSLTYDFENGTISAIEPGSSLNGWTQNIDELDGGIGTVSVSTDEDSSGAWVEDGTLVIDDSHILSGPDPLYFIAAVASSIENTDTISSSEWQGPILMSQDGADGRSGIDGFNQATISLYQRANGIPSKPGALTYIFASGELSGNLDNWNREVPTNSNGYPCYVISAASISREAEDTIASTDWSEPVIMVEDGEEGASVTRTQEIYYLTNGNAPTKPADGVEITSTSTVVNVWTKAIPTYILNYRYYTSIQTFLSDGVSPISSAAVLNNGLTDANYKAWVAKQSADEALSIAQGTKQYFWHQGSDYSPAPDAIPAGTYITQVSESSFKEDYNNKPNLLLRATSINLRYGVNVHAQLNLTGLEVLKGGVKGGTIGQSNGIYLSTENYGSNITINGHKASNWKEIIGTKFGVDADGTLYASNAVISGTIIVGSGSNIYTKTETDQQTTNAAKTATNYITHITDIGITLHPETQNNTTSIQLDETGLDIIKNGISIAKYGETARIGRDNNSRLLMNSNSLQAYDNNNQKYFEVTANGLMWGNKIAVTNEDINNALLKYIVDISEGGIYIHSADTPADPSSATAKGIKITDKIDIIRDGVSSIAIGELNSGNENEVIRIGNIGENRIEMDYHSLQMKDRENNTYFYVSDLRNKEGYITIKETPTISGGSDHAYNITQTPIPSDSLIAKVDGSINSNWQYIGDTPSAHTIVFSHYKELTGDGTTKTFSLPYYIDHAIQIKINNTVQSLTNVTYYNKNITFPTAPPSNSNIKIWYDSLSAGTHSISVTYTTSSSFTKALTFGQRLATHGIGGYSVSLGNSNVASGRYSYAEGYLNEVYDHYSHAEGYGNNVEKAYSHAEGQSNDNRGYTSHAEGGDTYITSNAQYAHAEGYLTICEASYGHVQNQGTSLSTSNVAGTAIGKYNQPISYSATIGGILLYIGNGTSQTNTSNALIVSDNGNVFLGYNDSAGSGVDYDLKQIITNKGWASEVLLDNEYINVKALLNKIIRAL